jgi:DNA-directed RNA polymerase subunit beta'
MSLLLDISPRPLEKVIYFASYVVIGVDHKRLSQSVGEIVAAARMEQEAIDRSRDDTIASLRRDAERAIAKEEAAGEREGIQRRLDDAIKVEEKTTEERKLEVENGLKLLLGPDLNAAPGLAKKQLLTETEYRYLQRITEMLTDRFDRKYDNLFRAGLGAGAVRELLAEIDLDELARGLRQEIADTSGPKRARAIKRLDVVPVIPPELRPMVQLDGGRFATSDLNDLYRRIINRNNRLKKIKELNAPESIINHEKRLLQEAVDALIDNGRRTRPVTGSNGRALKSLSDMLKGKEGRFRKNLLGKRVDYSGRSVIVVGPHLNLHECGLPKEMALELFKPFVMKRLVDRGYTANVKTAKKMVDRVRDEVWDALEEVISDHPVMLNRAPTLHRLGIQAFQPVLVDSKAIQLHPLVCFPFNADFDGDQMAVHVPLSLSAQAEARLLMLSTANLFSPAHGRPMVAPTRDMVLGCYYLTQKSENSRTERQFSNAEEAILAYDTGKVDLHAEVTVRVDGVLLDTTVGRVIFNEVLPPGLRYVDKVLDQPELQRLVTQCYRQYGTQRTVQLLDDFKNMGFKFATLAGVTVSMTDMDIPEARTEEVIERTEHEVTRINDQYLKGLITSGEREQRVCDLWTHASEQVSKSIVAAIDRFNPIFMMANSRARSTLQQITQLAGMRGLMTDPFGRFIEDLPIKSNFHDGLSVLEYFVSTHGARKGLADTALRTADAGYLTRRLVDVAQDVIIRAHDCGTTAGIWVEAIRDGAEEIEPIENRIQGRVAWMDIVDPRTDSIILRAGQAIGSGAVSPCPDCGRDLERFLECPGCGSQHVALSIEDAAVALAVEDDKGTPVEAVDAWDLGHCPECGTAVQAAWRCGFCKVEYAESDMEAPLQRIKRNIVECEQYLGRVRSLTAGEPASTDLVNPFTGEVMVAAGKAVNKTAVANALKLAQELEDKGGLAIGQVPVRSAYTCELQQGICALCYGRDLATDRLVEEGEAVGIIAAQSIGEPGTQLTMRTFHTGGVAGQYLTGVAEVKKRRQEQLRELHEDIRRGLVAIEVEREGTERERVRMIQQMVKVLEQPVTGLLRVVELFESRRPKGQAIVCEVDGVVAAIETAGVKTVLVHSEQPLDPAENIHGEITGEAVLHPKTKAVVIPKIKELTPELIAKAKAAGVTRVTIRKSYMVPYRGYLKVNVGDRLQAGDSLTEGPLDPQKVLTMKGVRGIQDYLVREIQSVYRSQGVDINDKHVEVIVRQMLRRRKVLDVGDADLLPGQVISRAEFEEANRRATEKGGQPATAEWVLLGITEASLTTDSFLSAASFQKTTRVLTEAAIRGKADHLVGLKENVIIGRLIPAGTGLVSHRGIRVIPPEGEEAMLAPPAEERLLESMRELQDSDEMVDLSELARAGAALQGELNDTPDDELVGGADDEVAI